jgi:hypothetical protein
MNQITKYFGRSFEIPHIEKDRYIPVGGTHCWTDRIDRHIFVDSDNLESLINEMKCKAAEYDKSKLKAWLESHTIDVDENLFAILYAFTDVYKNKFGFSPDLEKSDGLYSKESSLSRIVLEGAAACAEVSALAQLFLQSEGVNSSYFFGEVLWSEDDEFADAHTFIYLEHEDKEYIFDPMNPHVRTAEGGEIFIPRLQKVEGFKDKVSGNRKTYVETRSVLSGSTAFYGVGDGKNVCESDILK